MQGQSGAGLIRAWLRVGDVQVQGSCVAARTSAGFIRRSPDDCRVYLSQPPPHVRGCGPQRRNLILDLALQERVFRMFKHPSGVVQAWSGLRSGRLRSQGRSILPPQANLWLRVRNQHVRSQRKRVVPGGKQTLVRDTGKTFREVAFGRQLASLRKNSPKKY